MTSTIARGLCERIKNMEKQNELGRIYGSKISKSGKWLNLIIAANVNGEEVKITCPISLELREGKPSAEVGNIGKAVIYGIPVYEEKKAEQPNADAPLFQKGEDTPF